MVLSQKPAGPVKQALIGLFNKASVTNNFLVTGAVIGMLSLSGCQTAPSTPTTAIKTIPIQTVPSSSTQKASTPNTTTVTQAPIAHTDISDDESFDNDHDYPIEPYNPPEQTEQTNPLTQDTTVYTPPNSASSQPDVTIITPSRDDYMTPEPVVPSHNELLERARKNSQQRTQQSTSSNSNLPAFRNLMQAGVSQLKSGQLTNAENSFTRAQRLAPKSSAVYFYLSQVALKKNQPRKAEAMARRGLSVSQDANRRRALWQLILQSGQAQGNARVVSEAKRALR